MVTRRMSDDDDDLNDSLGSGHSGSSKGSQAGTRGTYQLLQPGMCGAIFTPPAMGDQLYVCYRGPKCRRPGHKEAVRGKGVFGALYKISKSQKGYYDRGSTSIERQFRQVDEAWEWVRHHTQYKSPAPSVHPAPNMGTPPPPPAPVIPVSVTPVAAPPLFLSGKDKSTKLEDEVYGISLDVEALELRRSLAPQEGYQRPRPGRQWNAFWMPCLYQVRLVKPRTPRMRLPTSKFNWRK